MSRDGLCSSCRGELAVFEDDRGDYGVCQGHYCASKKHLQPVNAPLVWATRALKSVMDAHFYLDRCGISMNRNPKLRKVSMARYEQKLTDAARFAQNMVTRLEELDKEEPGEETTG